MTLLVWIAACVAFPALAADNSRSELTQVRYVYLLPMSSGFDQYLASHLTRSGRFQVVTDPQLAEALLTDRIGEGFEAKYQQLYPPPAPPADEDKEESSDVLKGMEERQPRMSSFGRSRGNFYLVDRRTRNVIWAFYKRSRNTQPDELDRIADYLVSQLKRKAGPYSPSPLPLNPPAPVAAPAPPPAPEPEPQPAPAPEPAPASHESTPGTPAPARK